MGSPPPTPKKTPSLRERKHAQTKLALLTTAIEKLKKKPLNEISVKEICDDIPVSEVTFYNYYPTKADLIHYYLNIWYVDVMHHLAKKEGKDAGLAAIEDFFAYNAKRMQEHPLLVREIIVKISAGDKPPCPGKLSQAELEQAFPDEKDITDSGFKDLPDIFRPYLKNAIEAGELPKKTDQELVLNVLATMFMGLLLTFPVAKGKNLATLYKQHLDLLWAGIRSRGNTQ